MIRSHRILSLIITLTAFACGSSDSNEEVVSSAFGFAEDDKTKADFVVSIGPHPENSWRRTANCPTPGSEIVACECSTGECSLNVDSNLCDNSGAEASLKDGITRAYCKALPEDQGVYGIVKASKDPIANLKLSCASQSTVSAIQSCRCLDKNGNKSIEECTLDFTSNSCTSGKTPASNIEVLCLFNSSHESYESFTAEGEAGCTEEKIISGCSCDVGVDCALDQENNKCKATDPGLLVTAYCL